MVGKNSVDASRRTAAEPQIPRSAKRPNTLQGYLHQGFSHTIRRLTEHADRPISQGQYGRWSSENELATKTEVWDRKRALRREQADEAEGKRQQEHRAKLFLPYVSKGHKPLTNECWFDSAWLERETSLGGCDDR